VTFTRSCGLYGLGIVMFAALAVCSHSPSGDVTVVSSLQWPPQASHI
jgi:hypothetical protein